MTPQARREPIPTPTLRLEEIGPMGTYDRVWLFLDYGEGRSLHRVRWAIGARGEDGLWLFAPIGRADTFEAALDLIGPEVRLARAAIARIRAGDGEPGALDGFTPNVQR